MTTIVQLEYLLAVDRHRNFARAADACFVTQPTLSMQIKKLEDELDVIIFDRSRKPVISTEAGRMIIDQARVILREHQKIDEIVKTVHNSLTGELKIGIIPTLAPYLLPRFAGTFKRKYPGIKLSAREILTEDIALHLKQDHLDAGIFVTPYHDRSLKEWPVFYEEMMVYAHPSHRLIAQQEIVVKDVETPDIWLLTDGHCFRDQVVNLCSIQRLPQHELPFEFEGGSLETLTRIVDNEGGFTLLPELATLEMPAGRSAQLKSFSGYTPLREVSLVYSRNYAKHRLLKLLYETIRLSVPEHMHRQSRGSIVEWKDA